MNLKKLSVFVLCLLLPFCLASCNFEMQPDGFINHSQGSISERTDDEIDSDFSSMVEYIDALTVITDGDGENTYLAVQTLVNKLTTSILDELYMEYGDSSLAIQRSAQDTHKNAIYQDGWRFVGPNTYVAVDDINKKLEWVNENFDKANYELILKYNIYQILTGGEILDIQLSNLLPSSEYFTLKAQGAFSEDSFIEKAKQVSHTGIFYYELDAISEYILKYVIGENVVAQDNRKFADANNNTTFDYNEKFIDSISGIEDEFKIIKDYSFNKKRAIPKSDIWDTISFGETLVSPQLTEGQQSLVNEQAYTLEYLMANNIANSYVVESETLYSGFKNYVNSVYYIVYKAVNSNDLTNHIANATYQDCDATMFTLDIEDDGETKGIAFLNDFDNYKALSLKLNENMSIYSFLMYIQCEDTITEDVKFSIDATYYHCTNPIKHEHSIDCEFEKVTEHLSFLTISPSESEKMTEELYTDLTLDEEELQKLKDKGFNISDYEITGFTKMGIKSFDITKFNDYAKDDESGLVDAVIANESVNLIGCEYEYLNGLKPVEVDGNASIFNGFDMEGLNDYLQINFKIVTNHTNLPKFRVGFVW